MEEFNPNGSGNGGSSRNLIIMLFAVGAFLMVYFMFPKNDTLTDETTAAVVESVTNIAADGTTNVVYAGEDYEETVAVDTKLSFDQSAEIQTVEITSSGQITLFLSTEGAVAEKISVDGAWNTHTEPVDFLSSENTVALFDFYLGNFDSLELYEDRPIYSVENLEDDSVTLSAIVEVSGKPVKVSRSFTVSTNYQVSETLTLENLGSDEVSFYDGGKAFTIASCFCFTPKEESNPRNIIKNEYFDGNKLNKVLKPGMFRNETEAAALNPDWMSYSDNYFAAGLDPQSFGYEGIYSVGYTATDVKNYKEYVLALEKETFALSSGESQSFTFDYYIGPRKEDLMKLDNPTYKKLFDWGAAFNWLMRPITWLLTKLMNFFSSFIPNLGVVIILMALVIKGILSPLSIKAAVSMRKTQLAQPKQKMIQEKYKDNPQKQQEEMMKFYKKEGINPMGGCLPMILQIPVFFSLFRLLSGTVELRGASFLWIKDLTLPDTLFTMDLPLLPDQFNLLPIIMTILQLISMKLQTGRTQKMGGAAQNPMNSYLMPVMFLFLFWNMPAGLTLYWTIQNVYSIVEQELINMDKHVKLKGTHKKTLWERLMEKVQGKL